MKYIHESDRTPQHREIVDVATGLGIGGKIAPLRVPDGDPRPNCNEQTIACCCFAALLRSQIPAWAHTCIAFPQVDSATEPAIGSMSGF